MIRLYEDYKAKYLMSAYRVYGIKSARLLFGLEIGTGEPKT
jgi:hypothetical protein